MRMQLPSRGGTCTHLQCFDATTFLMMNEKKATWLCPVCDKPTPFHKLIIDGLFVEILQTVHEVDEIQFVADGSWSPIKRNSKDAQTINSMPMAIKRSPVVPEKTVNLSQAASNVESTSVPTKKAKFDVIDLTETDSEDDSEVCRSQSGHEFSSGSSSPSLNAQHSIASPPAVVQSWKSNVPPSLPPLLNFKTSNNSLNISSSSPHSHSVLNISSPVGLNLSLNSQTSPYKTLPAQLTSPPLQALNSVGQSASSSTPSWWDTLNGHRNQNLKRPPPAHSGYQSPAKRMLIDNSLDSPSSSNSNMSPLVDLDQLCSILDSDRDKEIATVLQFPADFPMAVTANSSVTNSCSNNTRNIFNISPSDIISLD